jgi:hypothetical protein
VSVPQTRARSHPKMRHSSRKILENHKIYMAAVSEE